jgi:hypothetical protein
MNCFYDNFIVIEHPTKRGRPLCREQLVRKGKKWYSDAYLLTEEGIKNLIDIPLQEKINRLATPEQRIGAMKNFNYLRGLLIEVNLQTGDFPKDFSLVEGTPGIINPPDWYKEALK